MKDDRTDYCIVDRSYSEQQNCGSMSVNMLCNEKKIGLLSLASLLVGITAGKLAGNKLWMDSKH